MPAEPDGFREFVLARSPALLRTAWMLTGDSQLAEDLLQTALASTWPHWGRGRTGQLEAYVRTVMVRAYGSWWRRKWRGERPTADLPEGAAADGFQGLVDALNQLPTKTSSWSATCPDTSARDQYQLVFAYASGPDVKVTMEAGCASGVDNFSLASDDTASALAAVRALVAGRVPNG